MRDLFYTILAAWVVWKIYESFSKKKSNTPPTSGGFKVDIRTGKPKDPANTKDEEYVDYEEIK